MIKDLEQYKTYLEGLTKFELLNELGLVKKSKFPDHYRLLELEQKKRLEESSKREATEMWIQKIKGSFIRVRGYKDPILIVEATINSRGNAAIIRLEGENHNRYFEYKGDNDD